MPKFIFRLLWGLGLLLALVPPAAAQSGPHVLADTATPHFPDSLEFHLQAASGAAIDRVSLLYGTNARTCHSGVARQGVDVTSGAAIDASWEWEFERSGSLPRGAQVWWQWEIHDASGAQLTTEKQWLTIEDDLYVWRSLTHDSVTVSWAEGDGEFGQALLDEALASLDRLEAEVGVRPAGAVGLTIYPSAEALRASLLHFPEWTGGVAFPEYDLSMIGIEPDNLEWAENVIPHELAHLVVRTLVFNCRGADLPTWLDEGLATYSEHSTREADLMALRQALAGNRLPALRGLAGGFQADPTLANLSYTYSEQVTAYLIETHGSEKMLALLTAMRDGQRVDEALSATYGFDTDGLDEAWRASLGFAPPPTSEPAHTPAAVQRTAVPTLPLFTPAPSGPTSTPAPVVVVAASSTPAPASTSVSAPIVTDDRVASPLPVILLTLGGLGIAAIVGLVVVIGIVFIARRGA